jgi:hypothetical protein
LSFFEDAAYERMQVAEMARAQAVRRKSGGRISVTARLLSAPYLAQRSPLKFKLVISSESSSSPL